MNNKQKILVAIVAVAVVAAGAYFFLGSAKKEVKKIDLKNDSIQGFPLANEGPVSPISGLACDNWNRRPIAVMQPGDVTARPAAGFSDADMVIEMPVITAGITRLMAVYICNNPDDVGSMRSSRHDFIHIAKSLDAIFVPWGRSESHSDTDKIGLAQGILNRGEIESINCNGDAGKSANACPNNPCYRKDVSGTMRGVDTGYAKFDKIVQCAKDFNYRMEGKFSGYAHQGEAPTDQRPETAHLRIGFAGPYEVEYDYDKASNSFLRIWGNVADYDRNNKKRLAPKNIVVMTAISEQIEGQYNNVQLGDPWYDTSDSGEARYYINGKETLGTWKKDKSSIDSKLLFYESNGQEVKFVPGQIWVEVLEPGSALKWTTSQV